MQLVVELHGGPDDIELLEHPLHGHLLDGLVHDVVDLVLEVVQVQAEQVGKGRVFAHDEGHPGRGHELLPVAVADRWVLYRDFRKFSHYVWMSGNIARSFWNLEYQPRNYIQCTCTHIKCDTSVAKQLIQLFFYHFVIFRKIVKMSDKSNQITCL